MSSLKWLITAPPGQRASLDCRYNRRAVVAQSGGACFARRGSGGANAGGFTTIAIALSFSTPNATSSHLKLYNGDAFPTTKGEVMTKEQPSVVAADTNWAATLIQDTLEKTPQVTAQASAVMEQLLNGRLLERELTPAGLREVAQQLLEAITQATADPEQSHEN